MITVYADLNCPFCYALSEWVHEAGVEHHLDWRLIDHNPQASFFAYSDQELLDLTEEIFTIRQRAPDLDILLPQGRCNIRNAGMLLSWVKEHRPDSYFPLQRRVYRAYWAEDSNIESPQLLEALAAEVGLDIPELNGLDATLLDYWTQSWDRSAFDRRIPVIMHSETEFHLGLPPKAELLAYLQNPTLDIVSQSDSCMYEVRPSLAIMGDWSESWSLMRSLRLQYDLFFFADAAALAERCDTLGEPDLLLYRAPQLDSSGLRIIREAQRILDDCDSSMYIVCDSVAAEMELALYQCGCADVLVGKDHELILVKVRHAMEVRKKLKALLKSSLVDSLTQLQNRRSFYTLLEKEWSRASRSKLPLSLLMMDLDYFKQYNDCYGHLAGDGCLRKVAGKIKEALRRTDIACRYGGEEFIVILPETNVDGALQAAETVMLQVADEKIRHEASPLGQLTLSIGVTSHKYNGDLSINDLINAVDEQLYNAKASGRNNCKVRMFY